MNSLKLTDSKKAVKVVLVGIVIILSFYWYSQQSSQTEKPNFNMNGTIENITIPCPFNVQCNPQYWLDAEDGNTYHLLFGPAARLPNFSQHIEVIGIVTYTASECWLNDKETPCQPIGTVNVSSWQPR